MDITDLKDEDTSAPPTICKLLIDFSLKTELLLNGISYSYFSDVPPFFLSAPAENIDKISSGKSGPACVLGVDEAGRGPVLGPMVYGLFYLPISLSDSLLRGAYHFDDSKVLTAAARSNLMQKICTPNTDLYNQCGWAVEVMSARDISSNMLKPSGNYNLNAQAMDATISLIKGVYSRGVNIQEIYIDTIGNPDTYQKKLEKIFPTAKIKVAKKADSLYPCVSAASVCAKVTRDAALELLYEEFSKETVARQSDEISETVNQSWGSGYPSDSKCTAWLKKNMHPIFGWGNECRFSWGTAREMLDLKDLGVMVDWPVDDDGDDTNRLTQYFNSKKDDGTDELSRWFGRPVQSEIL